MTDAPDPFDALLSRLREDPALGNLLGPDAPVLVWNEDAGKLLWSSPSAARFGRQPRRPGREPSPRFPGNAKIAGACRRAGAEPRRSA